MEIAAGQEKKYTDISGHVSDGAFCCSWCGSIIGIAFPDGEGNLRRNYSNGICPECFSGTVFDRACGFRTEKFNLVKLAGNC
jgi:hypothetical protein